MLVDKHKYPTIYLVQRCLSHWLTAYCYHFESADTTEEKFNNELEALLEKTRSTSRSEALEDAANSIVNFAADFVERDQRWNEKQIALWLNSRAEVERKCKLKK